MLKLFNPTDEKIESRNGAKFWGVLRRHPKFKSDSGALKTWVEVVIEDVTFQDDLNERVKAVAEDRDFEVLKVLRERVEAEPGARAENASDEEALNFLDDPKTVFERLLEQHEGIQKKEAEDLKAAFAVLFEKNSQNEGELPLV